MSAAQSSERSRRQSAAQRSPQSGHMVVLLFLHIVVGQAKVAQAQTVGQ